MVTVQLIATALAGAALFLQSSLAHSVKRNPVSYVSPVQDAVIQAPSHRVHAHSHFDLVFTLHHGQTPVRLALEPNHDILHDDLSITYLGNDGRVKEVETVERTAHRVYKGRAFVKRPGRWDWMQVGWARIVVHRDGQRPIFEGSFLIHGNAHHIQTGRHYESLRQDEDPTIAVPADGDDDIMVVYRDSDIMPSSTFGNELRRRFAAAANCESDSLDFNSRYDLEMRSLERRNLRSVSTRSLLRRQSIEGDVSDDAGANYIDTIGSTAGCPDTRRVALLGIATDCNYWSSFDEDRQELRKNVIAVVNQASALYEDSFNISLGIRNLTVIDQACSEAQSESAPWNLACGNSVDLSDRLNLFSSWRGDHPDSNAYWTLMTTCNTGSAVGLAWRGQLCREGASDAQDSSGANETVAATNVVVRSSAEWQIFAHETGHTFGAVHDCTDDACPVSSDSQQCCPLSANTCSADGQYIMNPSTDGSITAFSPCSIGNICSSLQANTKLDCLSNNKNVGTITGSQCGNGIVEEGEDCDCGGAADCEAQGCCDADTCKFTEGSVCDPTNEDCCTHQCQFASNGTVCRASTSECDPQETCSGNSGNCPSDQQLDDGTSCGDGLHCASGECTSRDLQCRSMLGGDSSDNSSISACGGDSSCMLSCTYPGYANGQCAVYRQNFLDGTSCAGGGRCNNGDCQGSSTWGAIQEWFRDNKEIAIPVGCVLAALLLLAISCCVCSRCRRRIRNRRAKNVPEMSPAGGYSPRGPLASSSRQDIQPPEYTYAPPQGQWQRRASMRYA